MVSTPLALFQGGVSLGTAALYAYVARLVLQRAPSPDAMTANRFFAVWWGSLAALYVIILPFQVGVALGWRDLAYVIALLNALVIVIAVAYASLLGYLIYLYTGSHRWFVPLAVAYALLGFGLLYVIAWMAPTGFDESGTRLQITFARELGGRSSVIMSLMFAGPILLGALAYGSLYFRVRDALPRYRIGMVATGFILNFGWSILQSILRLQQTYPDSLALYFANQAIALLAPVLVLLAYRPPAWIRERLSLAMEA